MIEKTGRLGEEIQLIYIDRNFTLGYAGFGAAGDGSIYEGPGGYIYCRISRFDGGEAFGSFEINYDGGYTQSYGFRVTEAPFLYNPQTKEELIQFINDPNINLSDINTEQITDMSELFKDSQIDEQRLYGVAGWKVTNVTNFDSMFENCTNFNTILYWDMSSAITTRRMFANCTNLYETPSLSNMNNITDASFMFLNCKIGDISNITDLSSLQIAESMFEGCTNLNNMYEYISFYNLTNGKSMFKGCSSLTTMYGNANLSNLVNGESMFEGCTNLTSFGISSFTNVTNAKAMFKDCVNLPTQSLTFPNATDLSFLYYNNLKCVNHSAIYYTVNNSSAETYESMFEGCINLEGQDCNLNLVNCISTKNMFKNCSKFAENVSVNRTPTRPCTMEGMFEGCTRLGTGYYNNFNGFKFDNVYNIDRIFKGCPNINFAFNNVDTSSVKSMDESFSGCVNIPVYNNFDVRNVTSKVDTFNGVDSSRIPWWYTLDITLEVITMQTKIIDLKTYIPGQRDYSSMNLVSDDTTNLEITKDPSEPGVFTIKSRTQKEYKPTIEFLNGKSLITINSTTVSLDSNITIPASTNYKLDINTVYPQYSSSIDLSKTILTPRSQYVTIQKESDYIFNVVVSKSGTYYIDVDIQGLTGVITVTATKLIQDETITIKNSTLTEFNLNDKYPNSVLNNIFINNSDSNLEITEVTLGNYNLLSKGIYTYNCTINLNGDISNLEIISEESLTDLTFNSTATKKFELNLNNEYNGVTLTDIQLNSTSQDLVISNGTTGIFYALANISGSYTIDVELYNENKTITINSRKLLSDETRDIKSNMIYEFDFNTLFPDSIFKNINITSNSPDIKIIKKQNNVFSIESLNIGVFNCTININGENSNLKLNVEKLIEDKLIFVHNKIYRINLNTLYPGIDTTGMVVTPLNNQNLIQIVNNKNGIVDFTYFNKGTYEVMIKIGKVESIYTFKVFFVDSSKIDIYQYPETFINYLIKPELYDPNLFIYQYNQYGKIEWISKYFDYMNTKMKKYLDYIYLWFVLKTNQDLSNLDMLFINNNETYFYINFIEKYFTGIHKAFGSSSASVFWDGQNKWNENGVIWDKVLNISNLSVNKFKSVLRFINDINYKSFNIVRFLQFCKEFINADNIKGDEYIDVFVDDTSFEDPNNILLYVTKNTENTVLLDSILRSVYKQLMPMYDFRLNQK